MAARRYHAHRLRKGRVSQPGRAYAVTCVACQRQAHFADLYTARMVIRGLHRPAVTAHAETLAFVLMPDHLHWLLRLIGDRPVSAVVRLFKASASARAGRPLWQRGFHDHAIRDEDDLRTRARYLVANPLRAGLVGDVRQYPHWDAVWLAAGDGDAV